MTYILARQIDDVACIVSDSVVITEFTDGRVEHGTTAQKTGILFEGCIFGAACDDLVPLLNFLQHAQNSVRKFSAIQEKWDAFRGFVESYDAYPNERGFEVIVVTRSSGRPAIYQLDSTTRRLQRVAGGTSIGSGKRDLDDQIEFLERIGSLLNPRRFIEENKIVLEDFPYIYAAALNNIASGPDGRYLIEQGIGGYFNFIWQDSTKDSWQDPAVYVFVERGRDFDGLGYTYFRTAFVDDCFTVMTGAGEGNRISTYIATSPIVRPDLFSRPFEYDTDQLQEIGEKVHQECRENPYSQLIGMDLNTRRPFPIFVITDKLDCFDFVDGPKDWFSDALRYAIGMTDKEAKQMRSTTLAYFEQVMKPAFNAWIDNPCDRDTVATASHTHGKMMDQFYSAYSEDKETVFGANSRLQFRQAVWNQWPEQKVIIDTIYWEPFEERCAERKKSLIAALNTLLGRWEKFLSDARDKMGGEFPRG